VSPPFLPSLSTQQQFTHGIVKALDVTIGSTLEEAMELFVRPLPGVPPSHWCVHTPWRGVSPLLCNVVGWLVDKWVG